MEQSESTTSLHKEVYFRSKATTYMSLAYNGVQYVHVFLLVLCLMDRSISLICKPIFINRFFRSIMLRMGNFNKHLMFASIKSNLISLVVPFLLQRWKLYSWVMNLSPLKRMRYRYWKSSFRKWKMVWIEKINE
jgi:hypothetical protein